MIAIFSGIRRRWRRLGRRGAIAAEFALVLPVLLMATLGAIEAGHIVYTRAIIYGAVDQAARTSSLESITGTSTVGSDNDVANANIVDEQINTTVRQVAPGAAVSTTRTAYRNYSSVNAPGEPMATDTNGNGQCDPSLGETYYDLNNNGQWDSGSTATQNTVGGTRQVIVYTVTTTFPPLFPYSTMIFGTSMFTYTTTTALRNQPYGAAATGSIRSCDTGNIVGTY